MADGYIAIDLKLASKDFRSELSSAQSAAEGAFGKVSSAAVAAGQIMADALEAGASAIVDIGKQALELTSDYEQLTGGVETLFKESAAKVEEYADSAFQTAGMSANDYMETVTSFSASLLQSMGGDTDAAAEKANTAITDMSDNANKMGTDMESIQNAYQGFAKQNYTMLDNLKLGYGGTKEEMQRLIDDANKLRKAQGKSADLTIDSYADIVDAIHEVQDEMGITGTTAKESSSTIEGSVKSAQAAWENWLTGLGTGQDMTTLTENLVSTVTTAAENIVPALASIIVTGTTAMADQLPDAAANIVTSLSSALSEYGINNPSDVLNGIMDCIRGALSVIDESFTDEDVYGVLQGIGDAIVSVAEGDQTNSIASSVGSIAGKLVKGIVEYIQDHGAEVANAMADMVFNAGENAINSWWVSVFGGETTGHQLHDGEFQEVTYHSDGTMTYNADGGIFDRATLLGGGNVVGEAGAEAVIPLTDDVLARIGAGIASASGTGGVTVRIDNFTNNTSQDVDSLMNEIGWRLRAKGVTAWR